MKLTLDIDHQLLLDARACAAARGVTVSQLVDEALRLCLTQSAVRPRRPSTGLPLLPDHGGLVEGVDPLSHRALLAAASDDMRPIRRATKRSD